MTKDSGPLITSKPENWPRWINQIKALFNAKLDSSGDTSTNQVLNNPTLNSAAQQGSVKAQAQTLTSVGSTQGTATQIGLTNGQLVFVVTATASTKGVKLPAAATGLGFFVAPASTMGCKVYPPTNGKIGSAATNTALTIAGSKSVEFWAMNKFVWRTQVGA